MTLLVADLLPFVSCYALVILQLKHKLGVRLPKLPALTNQFEGFLRGEFLSLDQIGHHKGRGKVLTGKAMDKNRASRGYCLLDEGARGVEVPADVFVSIVPGENNAVFEVLRKFLGVNVSLTLGYIGLRSAAIWTM